MNFDTLWLDIFGTNQWLNLNIGFWVSLALVLLIVIVMNAVFWLIPPKN